MCEQGQLQLHRDDNGIIIIIGVMLHRFLISCF